MVGAVEHHVVALTLKAFMTSAAEPRPLGAAPAEPAKMNPATTTAQSNPHAMADFGTFTDVSFLSSS